MAKRISSSEPKPRRAPARRRTEKPAASPVPPVEPVEAAAAAPKPGPKPAPAPAPKPAPAPAPAAAPAATAAVPAAAARSQAAPAGTLVNAAPAGTLVNNVSLAASSPTVWGREDAKANRDAVARRAFELFLARGGVHGHDVEDWLAAERELRRR